MLATTSMKSSLKQGACVLYLIHRQWYCYFYDMWMMMLIMTIVKIMMIMQMIMFTTTSTNSLTECMCPVASTKSSGLSCCSISHIPEMLVIVVINMLKQFMINDIFNITTTSSSPWTRPGLGTVPRALQDGGRHNCQNIISIVTIGNWWSLSFSST